MEQRFAVRAPGRVNLIGEHTDYNGGFVLPVAIDLEIIIRAEPTDGREVRLRTADSAVLAGFNLDADRPPTGDWTDYVAGVAWALREAGVPIGGLAGRIASNLPVSAGLSSSAALELAVAWALIVSGTGRAPDRLDLARICQRAENEYVGVRCGLMDQFAVSCGLKGQALLLDCRSLAWRAVTIPAGLSLVVIDTGTRRRLADSEFNQRRSECEQGVALLRARGLPVTSLRDATVAMLDEARSVLGDVVYRRCRHVIEENERTLSAAAALQADDRTLLGALFAASHLSLRDLYEVSSPALDAAVEVALATPGVVAARMTGGGFGGCTVNLVENGAVGALRVAIEHDYPARTGLTPVVHIVKAVDGAGLVTR